MATKQPSTSTSSNVPIQKKCEYPGKVIYTIWRTDFEIDQQYVPIKGIGKGAYGIVCSAHIGTSSDKVAVKKIPNAFENEIDARRTLREVTLLRQLKHKNIIALKDIMKPVESCKDSFKDVYLVYELMDTDLHQIIRSKQPLTDGHFQYFVYQILLGLKYIHSADVLHRDLKPSNLLLNASCDLKICDFGLARTREASPFMTEYVVTRWYRAPELLLNSDNYTPAIDMWSVGCIIAEMLGRRPLFPGKDPVDQLRLIVRVLGVPSEEDMAYIKSEKAKHYIRVSLQGSQAMDFSKVFPDANPLAIDLMEKMLRFDPSRRITVDNALQHPYLEQLHSADETVSGNKIQLGFEDLELSGKDIRERIYREVCTYYKPDNQPAVPCTKENTTDGNTVGRMFPAERV